MEFSRREYWSEFSFSSPGDLSHRGIEPGSPALQANSLLSESLGKPYTYTYKISINHHLGELILTNILQRLRAVLYLFASWKCSMLGGYLATQNKYYISQHPLQVGMATWTGSSQSGVGCSVLPAPSSSLKKKASSLVPISSTLLIGIWSYLVSHPESHCPHSLLHLPFRTHSMVSGKKSKV